MFYIRKYLISFLFALALVIIISCASAQNGKPTTGAVGKVIWQEGNLMPSPDVKKTNAQPIQRIVRFYEVTNIKQTVGQAPLFSKVATKLIAETKTNKEGYFQCKLKPGLYSYFTLEPDNLLFANNYNGNGEINVIEVKNNEVVNLIININYKAVF